MFSQPSSQRHLRWLSSLQGDWPGRELVRLKCTAGRWLVISHRPLCPPMDLPRTDTRPLTPPPPPFLSIILPKSMELVSTYPQVVSLSDLPTSTMPCTMAPGCLFTISVSSVSLLLVLLLVSHAIRWASTEGSPVVLY